MMPTVGKAPMTDKKNHKAEGVKDHPLRGRAAAIAGRENQREMKMVIASGDEALNRAKYLQQRRIVATKEKELQVMPVAALIGTITVGATESTHLRAAILSTGTTGTTVTVLTQEARAEITATRSRVA